MTERQDPAKAKMESETLRGVGVVVVVRAGWTCLPSRSPGAVVGTCKNVVRMRHLDGRTTVVVVSMGGTATVDLVVARPILRQSLAWPMHCHSVGLRSPRRRKCRQRSTLRDTCAT
jgi:hypothetical protein